MKKVLCITLALMLALMILTGCQSNTVQSEIAREVGIDVKAGETLSDYDTHSGNGDGISCLVLQFSDDYLLNKIENDASWKAFPGDATVRALIYGYTFDDGQYGPYITDEKGKALVPDIENGYYWLKDRQAVEGKATGADILHRHSLNFTLAAYDSDAKTLYYCKMDT